MRYFGVTPKWVIAKLGTRKVDSLSYRTPAGTMALFSAILDIRFRY